MNLFKTLGLGAYYRVRRISKALKNWKKFGVVIFGAIFAMANIANLPAIAALDVVVDLSPNSATINVGESQVYRAQVHEGVTNVTNNSSINWTVKLGSTTVQTGSGASIVLAPTTAGTYNITASATYQGRDARLLNPATLKVNAATDNRACVLTISPSGSHNIQLGANSPTFTAKVLHGNDDITNTATISWTVTRNSQVMSNFGANGKTFQFKPTVSGLYQITARTQCGDKVAYSNVVNVTVQGTTPPADQDKDLVVDIAPNSATIEVGESQTYWAQVHLGVTNVTGQSTFNWTVKKGSTVVKTGTGQSINIVGTEVAHYDITVAAVYQGRNARLLNPATLDVVAGPSNVVCVLTITPTGTRTITLGEDSPTWTANLKQNGQDITDANASKIQWSVVKDGVTLGQFAANGKTFKFKPVLTGTYTIQARSECGTQVVWSEVVTLNVNPPANVCVDFKITPASANLGLVNGVATQTFTVSAKDQNGNVKTLTGINWQLTGNGSINSSTSSSVVYTATTAGNASLKVTTNECGSLTAPITVVSSERVLFRVEVTPDIAGPVTCPATVSYTARGYDQNGQFIDPAVEPITFTWTYNSTYGTLLQTTGSTVQFRCNPGHNGTFLNVVTATGHYKNMTAPDSAGINMEDLIIQDTLKCPVTVSLSRNPISTNDSTVLTAQAFTTTGAQALGATFNWQVVGGNGSLSSNSGSSVTFFSGSMVGSAVVRLVTTYAGSQCTQDIVINVQNNNFLRVELTPDPAYAQPNSNITFTARAWDEFNNEVTSSTSFSWSMLNPSAGVITNTFANQAIVRTGSNFGTFSSAIQVTGFRNNRSASDTATIIIQQNNQFVIDGSLTASVANNNNGVCTDDMITFRMTVVNNQPNTLNGVKVGMPLPANTQFVSATSVTGSPYIEGNQVVWVIGTLGMGQSRVMEVRVMPTGNLRGNHRFQTTATAYAWEVPNGVRFTSNPIDLNCGGVTPPKGKGPLAPTGIDWQALGLIALASLVFASGTYAYMRRREQRF